MRQDLRRIFWDERSFLLLCTRETNSVVHEDAGVLMMVLTVMMVMMMMTTTIDDDDDGGDDDVGGDDDADAFANRWDYVLVSK